MNTEIKLAIVIVVLSLAMPAVSYWSFRVGYKLYPEVHGMIRIQSPAPQLPPKTT